MIKKLIPILGFVLITSVFFWQLFLKGLVPIPSDTIVGLYYPYRDLYENNYPNGIPFKNFLITDPVRQQFPWRELSIESLKGGIIPSWNPYSFSGTPNIANFQSAAIYPLNLILFISPFEYSWSFLIFLQPLLASIFMYFYLRNLKLDDYSSFFGGVVFAFSGFFAMWLEWGTVLHTALWLPLILLSVDKICEYLIHKSNNRIRIAKKEIKNGKLFAWGGILIFAISSSFFAGHLQTFFYLSTLALIYLILRIPQNKNRLRFILFFFAFFLFSTIIILPQLVPSLKFILLSGRGMDQVLWQKEGWFIPLQQLIQFLIPDFFGNPTTLNYWGVWNYGELTGYVGIVAITLSLISILYRRDKKTFFFTVIFLLSILFAVSNPISKMPFLLNIPFISTAQPTRLLFLTGFSLSVLSALGLNYYLQLLNTSMSKKEKFKKIIFPTVIILILFFVPILMMLGNYIDPANLIFAKRNFILPFMIFVASSFILITMTMVNKKIDRFLLIF